MDPPDHNRSRPKPFDYGRRQLLSAAAIVVAAFVLSFTAALLALDDTTHGSTALYTGAIGGIVAFVIYNRFLVRRRDAADPD